MKPAQAIKSAAFRGRLSSVLEAVAKEGASFEIQVYDRPVAYLIGLKEYALLRTFKDPLLSLENPYEESHATENQNL